MFIDTARRAEEEIWEKIDAVKNQLLNRNVYILDPILDKVFDRDSSLGKVAKFAIQIFASIAIAVGVLSLAGVSLTFTAGIYLSLAMIPVSIITSVLFGMIKDDK